MRNNNKTKNITINKTSRTTIRNTKKINFKLIYNLYKTHFIDNCELILLEKQNNFLDKFFNKMKLIIKNEYDEDIFDKDKTLYEITKKCENDFISDVYWPMYDSCTKGYDKFKSSKTNMYYLSNFLSHCSYEQIALHTCGSKFIQIPSNSNINLKLYALCTGCKKCYFNSMIQVYCPFSQKKYFSKMITEEEKNLPPATWEEYHCKNPIINEQMSCIECGEKFWIKKDKLFCKNCKFEVDPLLIIWTCSICKTEFKSEAKVYNPLEYKELENSIKEAIIYKKIVKPNETACKCIKNTELKNYDFCHKPNGQCNGVLYLGNLKNEDILVCSLCNSIYQINKFIWNCPICRKKFITNKININSKLYSPSRENKERNSIIKSEKTKKNNFFINADKNSIYLKYKGSPIRDLNSYIKKKPDDSYNYSNKTSMKNKKRNLSINFSSKINDINDIDNNIEEPNQNKPIEKDYKYATNNNFYIKTSTKYDINKDIDTKSNYLRKKETNINEFFSPIKNDDNIEKKYSKIQLSTRFTKKYNVLNDNKRYASTSARNFYYYDDDNGETSITDFKKNNPKRKNYQKYSVYNNLENNNISNSEIYIPKRKLDLNKSNNLISFLKEYNENHGNSNKNNKINNSNSVSIRERYKKINRKVNNCYEKRNLKTMSEENNVENNNNLQKKYKNSSVVKNEGNNESKTNTDFYKEMKSSSQYNIEKDKFKSINIDLSNIRNINKLMINEGLYTDRSKVNDKFSNIKHKYNKRNIGNKYIFNYNRVKINKEASNIYRKGTNNFNNKEKSGTNISNGGDNILINNILTNNDSNNNLDIIHNKIIFKEEIINSLKRDKKTYMNKNLKNNINQEKSDTLNNNNNDIAHSFKNGANTIKEFDNLKKYKTVINNDKYLSRNESDELKEFNFNDYKIITQLGQGTFGKIYLVQDKNNELFSMKKIILSEELDVQSVINEYKMCQKLKHSNVVKILGIYNNKLDKTTYVVYVLMEVGLTDWEKEIRKYNDKGLEYTEKELIEIIKQLSSVLSFLQKNNISHRDIKPQNILVFKNNIYKVADFGEAKQIDTIAKNLINYSLRGTELYMSPLLFNGLRTGQIDIKHNLFKSDVYSLGLCVLYACVTNNKPLYEIRKYVDMFNVKKFLDKLLKGKYSHKFISLLTSMLEIHEKNRPDFVELEKTMQKWK